MYTTFFGINEKPFSITPDPRYLFLSERHAEALAHLLYGITESGGFIQLTGEVGTGKTTLVRSLLEQLPEHADVALILNPRVTAEEFLVSICEELSVEIPETRQGTKVLVDSLNRQLLDAHAAGRRVVLIVDEAQNLSADVLEQVRLLTNLETAKQKLLQIILIGQPELRELLDRNDLRQLAQRITARYHLEPLSRDESADYVQHRLRVAGASGEIFRLKALREIHRLSGGIPRIINEIADYALLGAFSEERQTVAAPTVRRAASELFQRRILPWWTRGLSYGLAVAGIGLIGLALWQIVERAPVTAGPAAGEQGVALAAQPPPVAAEPAPEILEPPAPVVEPPAAPTLIELLLEHEDRTGTESAFTALFDIWGREYSPQGAPPCEQAETAGLRCEFQRGSWGHLQTLNRPAILTLSDDAGRSHQVVLTGVDTGLASLRIGGDQYTVSVAEVVQNWFGEFLLLWQPPTPDVQTLAQGMRGDGVRWLRQGLDRIQGEPTGGRDEAFFDAQLADSVKRFQRTRRLDVDGIAGVRTQIMLNTALNSPGTPRLTSVN